MSAPEVKKRLAVFMSFSGEGGVEKMICNLTQGMIESGFQVDLVLARAQGGHLESIPEGVRLFNLGTRHTLSALPRLINYLRREDPDALLAVKDRAIRVAVIARFLARSRVHLAGRIGTTVSAALTGRNTVRRSIWYFNMRLFYRFTSKIIAVSDGVARDILEITSLPTEQVTVVRNPVVTPARYRLAEEPVPHPWFEDEKVPIIIGAGRLTRQKDFITLLKAFAVVRKSRPCRLVILGEGGQREDILDLAIELGVNDDLYMPGFVNNPYSFLARSSLFVLSSRWEGSPNVLTEALALGLPVVSTDCPSGPREILQDGRYGPLTAVGDPMELAEAIEKTLVGPLSPEVLKESVSRYTVQESVQQYLQAMNLSR